MFELHVNATTFDHRLYITNPDINPLYGRFKPVHPTNSYIAASLDEVIPPSLWASGLKDWETDGPRSNATAYGGDLAPNRVPTESDDEWNQKQADEQMSIGSLIAQRREKRGNTIPKFQEEIRALRQEYEDKHSQETNSG